MVYTKDAQGNIINKGLFGGLKKSKPVEVPPPLPPTTPEEQNNPYTDESSLVQLLLNNQKLIYDDLQLIKADIGILKDDSVEEATDEFKTLQEEVVAQIAELKKEKDKVKK